MKKWISLLAVSMLAATPVMADVIFDDFDNQIVRENPYSESLGNNQSALGEMMIDEEAGYYDAGYWYAYNESDDLGGEDGASQAIPNYKEDKDFVALGDNSTTSQCLSISITHGDGVKYPFYGVGANISITDEYHDLTGMSSIEFYSKGTAGKKMKMVMKTKEAKVDFADDWGDYDYMFTLTSDWTKFSAKVSDFKPSASSALANSGAGFATAGKEVEKIHFQTSGATAGMKLDFAVDNIIIKGMDASDFSAEGTYTASGEYPDVNEPGDATVSSVADAKVVATKVELGDAYPNPFNPVTTINFSLPTAEKVSLKVFDAAGNLVKTLYNGVSASESVQWNATNVSGAKVASGVYFYRLTSGSKVVTKKMVLLK